MKIEHLALNVPDPVAMAQWYEEYLGMKVVKAGNEAPFVRFIADDSGTMLELYQNTNAPILEFNSIHHLSLHLAFLSDNPRSDVKRLAVAGATFVEELNTPEGDCIAMMKDPWGVAIQLCKRANKLCSE
ncbi:MAG: VOC family protein [Bacteroidales bacterium]